MRAFVKQHGFVITELSYRRDGRADLFEYKMVMWSVNPGALASLGRALLEDAALSDFTISPIRD